MNTSSLLHCRTAALAAGALFAAVGLASAQPKTIIPDLASAPGEHGWKFVNGSASLIDKEGALALRIEAKRGSGFVRLDNFTFANGTIEFDARGRTQSPLGIGFHGVDTMTCDVVYFRPFNFQAADPARRQHAVQYISRPTYTWQKLRAEHPGHYEKPVTSVPDPDGWFHVRVVVAWPKVSVFVNDVKEPCLAVDQLSDRKRGWLALWTDVAGGDFANLRITPATP